MKHTKQLSTHSRVIKDLLTKYKDTFVAFCELLNNCLQAKATQIDIVISYTNSASDKSPLTKIELTDNGWGVTANDFENKILLIGTDVKKDGKGIGRFGALQVGEKMTIETVAYDNDERHYSKVFFPLDSSLISSSLAKVHLNYDVEKLKGQANPYYKVTIERIHHNNQGRILPKNKISEKFKSENIQQALFEHYPLQIFNREVKFTVNGQALDPNDFVEGQPIIKKLNYADRKGLEHHFDFHFYKIKSALHKVKVFFYIDNAGIKTVGHEFTYSSDWYTPDLGTWFIYIDSSFFNTDLFRNIDLDSLGDEEIKSLKEFIKETVNVFFKANNLRFEKFIGQLEKSPAYPDTFDSPLAKSRELVFQKIAYIVEDEYKLLDQKNEKVRGLFYSLIDRALANGHVEEVFNKVVVLSDEKIRQFHDLLQKTELENVITFSSKVVEKLQFIDFLHELTYGDISKVLLERSQLHKIIERELWLFGEAYNGCPNLWSDKKIGNILSELRDQYLAYQPSKEDDNLIELPPANGAHSANGSQKAPNANAGLGNITDLFFYNEKILDNEDREIMVVELKSPRCAIGKKELQQIDDYAYTVESFSGLPRENTRYKFILISSRLTAYAKSKMRSAREKYNEPFVYDRKADKNIEVLVMEWSELMEINKRKLGYLSSKLKIKDANIKEKFESEYASIINEKVAARLTKTRADKR